MTDLLNICFPQAMSRFKREDEPNSSAILPEIRPQLNQRDLIELFHDKLRQELDALKQK